MDHHLAFSKKTGDYVLEMLLKAYRFLNSGIIRGSEEAILRVIHAMDAFRGSSGVSDSDGKKAVPVYLVCQPKGGSPSLTRVTPLVIVREMGPFNNGFSRWRKGFENDQLDFRYDAFRPTARAFGSPLDEQDDYRAISRLREWAD